MGRSCDPPLCSDAAAIGLPPGPEMSGPIGFVGWRGRAALPRLLLAVVAAAAFADGAHL